MPPENQSKLVLLTGATGYVGGRLLAELTTAGHRVRCLARQPEHLRQRVPANVEVVAGDLLNGESILPVLAGVAVAYYLVHSMGSATSRNRTGVPHRISQRRRRLLVSNGSFTSAVWARMRLICRLICAVGTRLVKSCVRPVCR